MTQQGILANEGALVTRHIRERSDNQRLRAGYSPLLEAVFEFPNHSHGLELRLLNQSLEKHRLAPFGWTVGSEHRDDTGFTQAAGAMDALSSHHR
jgi:hypothetical protein